MRRIACVVAVMVGLLWAVAAGSAGAQERRITIAVHPAVADSELWSFLLPRFSLKHSIRTAVVPLADETVPPSADVVIGPQGTVGGGGQPAMAAGRTVYVVRSTHDNPDSDRARFAARFVDWLMSDTGQATLEDFTIDGDRPFSGAAGLVVAVEKPALTGDPKAGYRLSLAHCGRCHVVGKANRGKGIGSTPSFGVLRTLGNWQDRFFTFYALNPHPAFTVVDGITPPFDETRPPPIVPLRITQNDLDAIVAYAETVEPADLGSPIQHQ